MGYLLFPDQLDVLARVVWLVRALEGVTDQSREPLFPWWRLNHE